MPEDFLINLWILQDNLAEHLSLLSFLDSGGEENTSSFNLDSGDSTGTFAILKERFAHYLAYERKSDSSKFTEFWVPIQLSHVQLEQYCATLVSSSIVLRSCCKVDHVGALRDILISTRQARISSGSIWICWHTLCLFSFFLLYFILYFVMFVLFFIAVLWSCLLGWSIVAKFTDQWSCIIWIFGCWYKGRW